MRIAVIPTKFGHTAVALGPYWGEWELYSPVDLPEDLKIQLRAQILHRLAQYCHEFSPWVGQIWTAVPWAIWGILAVVLSSLFQLGIKYIALYGWIRLLFFFDGVWILSQVLTHGLGSIRAQRIRKEATRGEWKYIQASWPAHISTIGFSEREYLANTALQFPQAKPFIDEMLRTEPPWIFSAAPLGVVGYIKYLLMGIRVAKPILIFELGMLEK